MKRCLFPRDRRRFGRAAEAPWLWLAYCSVGRAFLGAILERDTSRACQGISLVVVFQFKQFYL